MGAFAQLSRYYDDIIERAQELGYSEENLLILVGDEQVLKKRFPVVYSNLLSCGHHKDGRSFMEYAQDLVASWIFEDDLMAQLTLAGLEITGAGADRERKILTGRQVSTNSDCLVSWCGRSVFLELMSDYTGYWTRTGTIDLRDDKYNKLTRNASLFLGVSTKDKKFIFLDFGTNISANYIASHRPYGGKPAYQIQISEDMLIPFNIPQLIGMIKTAIEE